VPRGNAPVQDAIQTARLVSKGTSVKKPPNKKRPRPLRVMGRPNSPPPELLKHKVLFCGPSVNPTIVPTCWHETAIRLGRDARRRGTFELDNIIWRTSSPRSGCWVSGVVAEGAGALRCSEYCSRQLCRLTPAQKLVASVHLFAHCFLMRVAKQGLRRLYSARLFGSALAARMQCTSWMFMPF